MKFKDKEVKLSAIHVLSTGRGLQMACSLLAKNLGGTPEIWAAAFSEIIAKELATLSQKEFDELIARLKEVSAKDSLVGFYHLEN